jgi:predicted membrane chloride channel (bestrophin family)
MMEGLTTQQQFETLINLMDYNISLTKTTETQIMALRAEVQALVTADEAMDAAITAATAQLTNLTNSVATLNAEVTALQNQSGTIDATDLAAIVSATNDINTQVAGLNAVLPAPTPAAPAAMKKP